MASSPLVVVRPVNITDAMLVSTTVAEADHASWSIGTTYALADRCIVTTGVHKIYESLQATNLNHAVTDTAWWAEVSPTNRWKCFDTSTTTQTAQTTSAQYVLFPGQSISHVALLNNVGITSFRVRMVSAAHGAVYDRTIPVGLLLSESTWYGWFLGSRQSISEVFVGDIPNYADATYTIDIVGGSDLAFGVLLLGQGTSLGFGVQYGARVSIQDYSRKETNAYGDTVLVKRAYAKRASFSMLINASDVDGVYDFLAHLRATPCLWIGTASYTSTYIFGPFENFEVTISYAGQSDCTLNTLGLT